MNRIWIYLMLIGSCVLLITNPQVMLTGMFDASKNAYELCIELFTVYALWLGLLEILDKSGLSDKLANLLRPVIKKLFKNADEKTQKHIAINMSANILGLGNASTPSGIEAMKGLDDGGTIANFSMIMLMVINSTSIQLFPTTIIGLRTAAGSVSATDIILPTIIVSITTFSCAIGLVFLCSKLYTKGQALWKK